MTDNIKIKGKLYPLNYGIACQTDINEQANVSATVDATGNTKMNEVRLTEKFLLQILYYGLYHGHRVTGKPFNLTYYEMCDWIEGEVDVTATALNIYIKSKGEPEGNPKPPKKGAKSA